MKNPTEWTHAQLTADAKDSRGIFRKERIEEPVDKYLEFYDSIEPTAQTFVEGLSDINVGNADMATLLGMDWGLEVYRYLTAPPISADDLATLSGVPVSSALKNNPDRIDATNTTVQLLMDPRRFPWLAEKRKPKKAEIEVAVKATTALLAAQKVQTYRRGLARSSQEADVKTALRAAGFKETKAKKDIVLLTDAPAIGEFSGECMVGSTRADIVARLKDGRVLAIECKTSNSSVNSYKRVNHEALGKAAKWLEDFGKKQVVPAATLQGVFSVDNLGNAQERGLYLFWQFRLTDLTSYVK
ncbi:XamI family restriction endonuclease [Sphingomonas aerolata]|uniref:XamI family restriction endonuclease n=1 Tax=Sphingomonas aerolata TaxID=185951 RepID=UPI002FDFD9BB